MCLKTNNVEVLGKHWGIIIHEPFTQLANRYASLTKVCTHLPSVLVYKSRCCYVPTLSVGNAAPSSYHHSLSAEPMKNPAYRCSFLFDCQRSARGCKIMLTIDKVQSSSN